MKKILVVMGTRPEAIKLMPLYVALKAALRYEVILCATFQHDELLQQVFDLFKVVPDVCLNVMKKNQDLAYVTATVLENMRDVLNEHKPDLVIVQGDTATAFASALAAYYAHIPLGHVEAGLRTGNIQAPFPEESYRLFISRVASINFAPTSLNVANLLAENIERDRIVATGNTVVDALLFIKKQIEDKKITPDPFITGIVKQAQEQGKQLVLLTAHRRESFNGGLVRIFNSIKQFATEHQDVLFYYPVHPNTQVRKAIEASALHDVANVVFAPPISYANLVYLLLNVHWIVTDSGGIQEEAVSLGKRVVVLREKTERVEGIWEGYCALTGAQESLILNAMKQFYHEQTTSSVRLNTVYGKGDASNKIVTALNRFFIVPSTQKVAGKMRVKTQLQLT